MVHLISKRLRLPILASILILAGGSGAREAGATTITLPVDSYDVISSPTGESRILVRFGGLDTLEDKKILYAKCSLVFTSDTCGSWADEIEVRPLATAWLPTQVSWEAPWDSSGGDFVEDYILHMNVERGSDFHATLLLTELLQAWVDSDFAERGIILIPRDKECDYSLASRAGYPGTGYGKLIVKYAARPR
jgi:hypothetical protein